MKKNALVIYVKSPIPGKVKTRLTNGVPSLSVSEAADLYYAISYDLITMLCNSSKISNYDFYVCLKSNIIDPYEIYPGSYKVLKDVSEGDLGDSLFNSFCTLIDLGYNYINIIASDIPFMTHDLIDKAFTSLNRSFDLIFGPDQRGGCYLIGANNSYSIFHDIPWSKGKDYNILMKRAKKSKLKTCSFPELTDLDNSDDFLTIYKKINENTGLSKKLTPLTLRFFKMFHVEHPSCFEYTEMISKCPFCLTCIHQMNLFDHQIL